MYFVAPEQMLFQGNYLFPDSVERVLSNRDINFAKICCSFDFGHKDFVASRADVVSWQFFFLPLSLLCILWIQSRCCFKAIFVPDSVERVWTLFIMYFWLKSRCSFLAIFSLLTLWSVCSLNLLLPGLYSLCILWLQSRLSVFHGYFCFLTLSRVFSVASLCVVSLNWPEAQDNRPSPEIPTREPCKFVGSHTSLCR